MHRFAPLCMACMLLVTALLASGCAVYDVAVEERNASTWANDENITFTIKKQFFDDESISYMDFDAASYEGHVYILGEYDSHEQETQAILIAKSVEGVDEVTTYLLPKRAQDYCGTIDQFDIYRQVVQLLISDEDIWSTNIDVKVVQCNVVLLGIVGTHAEKAAAYAHATSVTGVRSVKSFIIVK